MKGLAIIGWGLMGIIALGEVGCSDIPSSPIQPRVIQAKLASNTVLKKGWTDLPIPIFISATVPEGFKAESLRAMDMWNEAAGVQLFDYQGITETASATDDGMNAIYWDRRPSPEGYFGETHKLWVNGDVLVEADVVFYGDPADFEALSCEDGGDACTVTAGKKDITTTALHELGHVLGFVHTAEGDRLMNPDFTYGDVFHRFDDTLLSELTSVYGPALLAWGE